MRKKSFLNEHAIQILFISSILIRPFKKILFVPYPTRLSHPCHASPRRRGRMRIINRDFRRRHACIKFVHTNNLSRLLLWTTQHAQHQEYDIIILVASDTNNIFWHPDIHSVLLTNMGNETKSRSATQKKVKLVWVFSTNLLKTFQYRGHFRFSIEFEFLLKPCRSIYMYRTQHTPMHHCHVPRLLD